MALATSAGRRPRRLPIVLLAVAMVALLWVATLGIAYRVGGSQGRVGIARLEAELATQGLLVRDLSRRAASAEQSLAATREELARLQRPPADVRAAELAALGALIDRRLGEGVTIARLAEAVAALPPPRRCLQPAETRAFQARAAGTREASSARFAGGRIVVGGNGVAARGTAGRPEAWIDVRAPVELRIEIGGVTSRASGVLPLDHVVIHDDTEYRFLARPERRRGFIEVVLTVCPPA
jgi:hypothetical protein